MANELHKLREKCIYPTTGAAALHSYHPGADDVFGKSPSSSVFDHPLEHSQSP